MMTLEEFIDQYRISDGRRYCKLEEGLQSRYIRQVYESYIDYAYEADRYFPNLDKMSDWKLTEESEEEILSQSEKESLPENKAYIKITEYCI